VAQVTVYAFNARNLLESTTYPDGGEKSFTYYPDGRLEETIDQSGNHILNVRDQLDRVTAVYYQDSSLNDKMRDVFSYYDATNRIDSFRYVNNVLTSEARIYNNDLGQILQERQRHYQSGYENTMKTMNYKYQLQSWNGGGLLTDIYAPNGQRIQYQYDAQKRLEKIYRISDGKRIARWKYNADWTTSELDRGNGIDTKYYRDANKNPTRIRTLNSGGTVFNLLYGYDPNNNVTYEDNTTESSWDETYGFDNANRLTAYKRGWFNGTYIPSPSSQSGWTLDDLYNWAQYIKDGVTQTRSHNLANEITQIDSTSVVHDDRGNLTDDGSKLYEWNIANQLVAVREKATNNLLGQYAFDSFGRRIWKKVIATGEEVDCFLTGDQVIEERRHTTSTAVTYNFVWGQYIDELVCRYTTGTDHYPVQNRQYSTYRVYNQSGTLVEKYRYSPYGQVEFYDASGISENSSAVSMTTLFTGREFDSESGLVQFRARQMSPTLGRFISFDSFWVKNTNQYTSYFIPNKVDPYGHVPAELAAGPAGQLKAGALEAQCIILCGQVGIDSPTAVACCHTASLLYTATSGATDTFSNCYKPCSPSSDIKELTSSVEEISSPCCKHMLRITYTWRKCVTLLHTFVWKTGTYTAEWCWGVDPTPYPPSFNIP
ncbi:MAG: RHS repeat-associated core domain-containing protein, partial [Planctomycetota bacterium]